MARTSTLSLFLAMALLIPELVTNHSVPAGEDMDETIPGLSDMPDCQKQWSCRNYDNRTVSGSYDNGKNCACDELCLLLRDCCPDAHEMFASLSGYNSSTREVQGRSQGGHHDGGKASVVDNRNSDSRKESSVLQTNGGGVSRSEPWPSLSFLRDDSDTGSRWVPNYEVYSRYGLDRSMFNCLFDSNITSANDVSLVTRCPEQHDDAKMTQLCVNSTDDDLMTRLPVSGKESRVLYRNMFCALCHGEPYLFWGVEVNCSFSQSLPYDVNTTSLPDLLRKRQQCNMQFQSPAVGYGWRPCLRDVRDRCNDTFPSTTPQDRYIVERCEDESDSTQPTVFVSSDVAYRNKYCYLCNHNNISRVTCDSLLTGPLVTEPEERISFPYSFSILLDINTGSATVGHVIKYETVKRNETVSCDQGQVFDPFRSVCRPVVCGPGRYFIDSMCRKKSPSADEDKAHLPGKRNDTSCKFIQLNHTEYRLFQNGTLELLGTDTFYNSSLYVLNGSQLYLCVDYSQNYTRNVTTEVRRVIFTFTWTEAVVSTCAICVSLVALAVTMFVYLSLRQLRNTPGRNLLSLVCSLFLGDLLLLVAYSAKEVFLACAVIAGLMHYFFLASFLWMNVTAVDVWYTFSKAFVKAGDLGKSSKRFLIYSAYCWLTPLVFLMPAALLQVLKPDSKVSPHYGEVMCWLNNKHALLLFFALPLFLLLLVNIVLFLLSACHISRAKRTTTRILGKEEEEGGRMAIYVKLTVVMGLTWVLGLLVVLVPGNKVLVYCYVIMNALQGFFICLSFVFTRRVLSLLNDKFCRRRRRFNVNRSAGTDLTNLSSKSLSGSNRKASSASCRSHNVTMM
ncbi:uncharacterized protein LOC143283327 [Babylonia areolata]|uniref:uncharacterized protein LOC143283327 n=1 Tax=Babylonia areolata TaxID=304850 RepID=UPI003FD365DC